MTVGKLIEILETCSDEAVVQVRCCIANQERNSDSVKFQWCLSESDEEDCYVIIEG